MCTLIVFTRAFALGSPLLVAANRDERLDRPAEPPTVRTHADVELLAPRDLGAGGTWLGLGAHGVFVAITNRFGVPKDEARRSRGLVVTDALTARSAAEAAARAKALDGRSENGFHLVVADRREAHLVWSDGDEVRHRALAPGAHVVTERSFGAAPTDREALIVDALAALGAVGPGAREPSLDVLHALLARHEPVRARASIDEHARALEAVAGPGVPRVGFDGVCVHVPELGYGTRSSTIVRFDEASPTATFLHADGPPCRHAHAPVPVPWPV